MSSSGVRGRGIHSAFAAAIVASAFAIGVSSAATADNYTFVQVQRVNSLTLRFDSDTFAPNNAFGGAFVGSLARNQM